MVDGFYPLASVTGGNIVVYKRGDSGPSEGAGDEIEGFGLSRVTGSEMIVVVLENCHLDFFMVG